jgi:hypothetical protein
MESDLAAISLKSGSTSEAIKIAITSEINAVSIDSTKNWAISVFLSVPNTLRIPTSLARLVLRAVLRFIKLMQAKMSMNKATAEKM